MGKMTICFCDLCGKDIEKTSIFYNRCYSLPYRFDDDIAAPTIEPDAMNLCEECTLKVHEFCKTLDAVNGYAEPATE